jgi:membrane protease YdiL (CAAX protease family)
MHSLIHLIYQNPVIVYFTLTFMISWGAVVLVAGPGGIPPSDLDQAVSLGMVLLLGPSTASLLMISLILGNVGFRDLRCRLVKWRVNLHWYLIALLTAPLLSLVVLLLLFSVVSTEFTPRIFTSNDKISLLKLGIMGGIIVAFLEELGWTGFALPKMKQQQKNDVFRTGLILGFIWGAWHFILFWESNTFSGQIFPFLLLVVRLFSWLPAYRILMVWVYSRTESLLVTILMHMSLVWTMTIIDPELSSWTLLSFILARAAILWIVACALQHKVVQERY